MTLGALVDKYLELHQAEPVTIAKLRWLLGKSTAALGEKRLADLSPKDVDAWRLTVPEGHRFEATQALRQVLNRAVDWGLIDSNPAKRGIRNAARRAREKRPFESWQQIERSPPSSALCTGLPQPDSGRRSCSRLSSATSTATPASSMSAAPTQTADSSTRRHGSATAPCLYKRKHPKRSTGCRTQGARSCSRTRQRQPRARGLAPRRARARTSGGRCVDVDASTPQAALPQQSAYTCEAFASARGRPVDAAHRRRRLTRRRKEVISSFSLV
jgi:hypothetical protein